MARCDVCEATCDASEMAQLREAIAFRRAFPPKPGLFSRLRGWFG